MSATPLLLYRGASPYHTLNPLTKVVIALCLATLSVAATHPALLLGLLLLLILLAQFARLLHPLAVTLARFLLPIAPFLAVVHGLWSPLNQTPVFTVAMLTVGLEGLQLAAVILLRLLTLFAALMLFAYTTYPTHLMAVLTERRWPPALVYILGSTFQLLPTLAHRFDRILAAQQSRGLSLTGPLHHRARALLPLIYPLIVGSLLDVETRTIALETRAFTAPTSKTAYLTFPDPPAERWLRRLALVATSITALIQLWPSSL